MFEDLKRRFAGWLAPELREVGISPRVDPSFWQGLWGRATTAGVKVNPGTALGITAFWRGIDLISSTIAALDLDLVARDKRGGFSPALGQPIHDILHTRPNKTTPKVNFWSSLISHSFLYKGGYAQIEWSTGNRRPLGLHLLNPRDVTTVLGEDRSVRYRETSTGKELDSSDVIHIRGLGWDGIEGYSLVDVAAETLGVARAQLIHEGAVFGNGAKIGGYVEIPGNPDLEQVREYRANFNEIHQGPGNTGKLGMFWGGAKFVPNTFSPVDAGLSESRHFAVLEICRLLGIPPHMLGVMEGATVGNAEQQALQFIKFNLLPRIKQIEGELDLKLLSPQQRRVYQARHDTRSLERGDMAARTAYYTGLFNLGAITPNQIMLSEGMLPSASPNADKHFIPTNNLSALEDWDGKPKPAEPDPAAPKESEDATEPEPGDSDPDDVPG